MSKRDSSALEVKPKTTGGRTPRSQLVNAHIIKRVRADGIVKIKRMQETLEEGKEMLVLLNKAMVSGLEIVKGQLEINNRLQVKCLSNLVKLQEIKSFEMIDGGNKIQLDPESAVSQITGFT